MHQGENDSGFTGLESEGTRGNLTLSLNGLGNQLEWEGLSSGQWSKNSMYFILSQENKFNLTPNVGI